MKEDKKFVEKVRDRSGERPQRIVIDEVLPGGLVRVLSAEMRREAVEERIADPETWGEEKEHYVGSEQLGESLAEEQAGPIGEGWVFLVKKGRWTSIHEPVKKHVKEMALKLLRREGKTRAEVGERRYEGNLRGL